MIKKISLLIILFIMLILFIQMQFDLKGYLNYFSHEYFLSHTYKDTASSNIVTGIYLDYRLFDSIFEASILLIVVSGIVYMTTKEGEENERVFIFEKVKISNLLTILSRVLYPFMLMFGVYIIIHGHLSPGGGFQGGAILATAVLITYYIDPDKITKFSLIIFLEKLLFISILIISSLSLLTKNVLFTNFIPNQTSNTYRSIFLILLNLLIGIKVSLGLVSIFSSFLKEGRS